ncbi:DNA mismatch repair protein MutL [Bdellovibrio bacteriovorus W]|nr:DNA mismatch repair protein MutL [Bdellovibrio bacteriovorus W]
MQIPLMSIQILSPEVVDQIAAGEVVERPAHLVKELVENSIDAGATSVHVEYFDGGRTVKVSDNGRGMSPEDLQKSLQRFATSKISKTDDLWALRTFGFRGEALASIASVSRLTLTSRQAGAEQAHQIISEYGKVTFSEKVGGSFGTSILVENLFQNTPARLKFLKSDSAEHTVIKTTLKAMALSHPHVELRIQENGKLISFWPSCDNRKDRVEQVLEIKPLFVGEAEREYVKAYAVFADPHNVAKTSKNIWLFAQNRWIQDRSLQAAVNEAYRSLLMHGEFPIAVVWVEVDPAHVDVNIHPTKSQVKFQEPSLAFRAVAASLRNTLEVAPWLSRDQARLMRPEGGAVPNPFTENYPAAPTENLAFTDSTLGATQFQKKDFYFPSSNVKDNAVTYNALAESKASREDLYSAKSDLNQSYAAQATSPQESVESDESRTQENVMMPEEPRGYWSSLEVLGQANLTYIITQAKDKIVFVDQHAAHERVVYEKLMAAWRGGKMEIQDFLFPLAIDMSPEKVEALVSLADEIARLGVHIEPLGPGTVGVKAAPLMIKESILSSVLDKMAAEIVDQGGSYSLERAVGDICATMACHSVVRAGQALGLEQMRSLLRDMDAFPLSSFCPHGRPVSVEYPFYKLEKDFGRIV